jgi:GNAT superfamily N-acetyltransferase
MDQKEFYAIRLNPEGVITSFDCGDVDLNNFLIKDAAAYQKERLAVTHLLITTVDNITHIAGYFCLLTDKLIFDPSENERRKVWRIFNKKNKMHFNKHRKTYPAIKIGRLAVANTFASKGLGSQLIDHIIAMALALNNIGCRFITVDAYKNAFDFYLKNDFDFLSDEDKDEEIRLMYIDLKRFTP